jgi:hypothetical protein
LKYWNFCGPNLLGCKRKKEKGREGKEKERKRKRKRREGKRKKKKEKGKRKNIRNFLFFFISCQFLKLPTIF